MNLRIALAAALLAGTIGLPAVLRAQEVEDLSTWQQAPVLDNGRVMPLDSYARHVLLGLSGKSTFNRQPAVRWLTRVLFTPEATRDDAIFLVNHPEVVEALGLAAEGRDRYSYAQLQPARVELTRLARTAFHVEDAARSPVETETMRLYSNLLLYDRLAQGLEFTVPQPELGAISPALRRDLGLPENGPLAPFDVVTRRGQVDALLARARASGADVPDDYRQQVANLAATIRMLSQHRQDLPPALIPLFHQGSSEWVGGWDALRRIGDHEDLQKDLAALRDMSQAFRDGRQLAFDLAARTFLQSVHARVDDPGQLKRIKLEVQYNRIDAFYRSELLYGLAFLVALLSVPFRGRWLYRAAAVLVIAALVPHTYGIVARMVIMERPPVTNLYTTFVFVSWVCVLLGLTVEYFQRTRLGLITASSMGLALLMTSARFGADGDTMGVMVAVLDSNFWLATHVVTISIGYAGCCAAGLLGHIYLLQALRRDPDDAALKETDRAVYGAQAFGLIFAFLGTMLGGIWADQSWGRFWGWDPKENGALVIVLWSAVLFHARLARLVGPRGFAVGSVLGVICVLVAWLGVNLLGVGLHSYGFTSGLARGLAIACAAEVVFVLVTAPFARPARAAR